MLSIHTQRIGQYMSIKLRTALSFGLLLLLLDLLLLHLLSLHLGLSSWALRGPFPWLPPDGELTFWHPVATFLKSRLTLRNTTGSEKPDRNTHREGLLGLLSSVLGFLGGEEILQVKGTFTLIQYFYFIPLYILQNQMNNTNYL